MKKISVFLSILLLLCLFSSSACAANNQGSRSNRVQFTGSEMISNFSSSDLEQLFKSIQPGDSADAYVKVLNSSTYETLWYMHNEAIQSLEESCSSAYGGYYSYKLTYTGPSGKKTVLYDSDNIGGEGSAVEGLNQISKQLKDYFYLDTLQPGEQGEVCLHLQLEGETQGNGYQNTIASLEAQFAVEPTTKETIKVPYTTRPKTGDDSALMVWIVAGAVSLGAALLLKKKNVFLAALLLFTVLSVPASADEYLYNISVFSGEQGAFDDAGTDCITYLCKSGDPVNFSQEGLVALVNQHLKKPDKYIATGIRLAGRDNDQSDSYTPMSFDVTKDVLYCVTYEVITEPATYTVTYTTEDGKQLLTPETYQANVGDRVVVAFKYVDGYEPVNARNITGTVKATNTTFNFKYRPIARTETVYVEVTPAPDNTAGTLPANNNNAQANTADQTAQAAETPQNAENPEPTPAAEAEQVQQPEAVSEPVPTPAPTPAPAPAPTPVPQQETVVIEEPAMPAEMLDLDPPEATPLFDIGDVAVPLATLQNRADQGDRSAKTAIIVRRVVIPGLLTLIIVLIALFILAHIRKKDRTRVASYYGYAAPPASPSAGAANASARASRAESYQPAWKDASPAKNPAADLAEFFNPDDFDVEKLFNRKDL